MATDDTNRQAADACGAEAAECLSRRAKRRRAMLEAARALFAERGYGATGLGDIVKRSGGSLATLYDLFGGKPGLFRAMIEEQCERLTRIVDSADIADRPPADALREIGGHLLDILLAEDSRAFFRLVVAEAVQFPELGELFLEAGPRKTRAKLAAYLERQAARGILAIDDPERAAMLFSQIAVGDFHWRALFGGSDGVPEDAKARHVEIAVQAFMRLYGPDRPA